MSWYYRYYIGKKIDGKIEIIGPYDNKGQLHPVLELSRSFASSLKDRFIKSDDEELKERMKSDFVSLLPYNDLPKGSYIKTGYFLVEDVQYYLNTKSLDDIFYEKLSPEVYAEKLKIESVLGAPETKINEYGDEYKPYSCADYIYFAYPDYTSKEYEAFLIREMADILDPFLFEGNDIVIVMTEG